MAPKKVAMKAKAAAAPAAAAAEVKPDWLDLADAAADEVNPSKQWVRENIRLCHVSASDVVVCVRLERDRAPQLGDGRLRLHVQLAPPHRRSAVPRCAAQFL